MEHDDGISCDWCQRFLWNFQREYVFWKKDGEKHYCSKECAHPSLLQRILRFLHLT